MKLFGTYLLPLGVCAWSENESVLLRQRRLGYEWIAGYEPRTLITDHSAIDLDQLQMEMSLKSLNFDEFEAIYENGGHSMSIAKVILKNPKPPLRPIPANTVVLGTAVNGDVVTGVLLSELSWTTEDKEVLLLMQYAASDDQANHLRCQVGGLVKVLLGTIQDGCLAENGRLQILDLRRDSPTYHFDYEYKLVEDNYNGRTVQKFSSNAKEEMWDCPNCPYSEYEKFVNYYDVYDYGDQWVQAALKGEQTSFANGNADFSDLGRPARAEGIKVFTKFMNIYMYVIRTMEHSLDQCEQDCVGGCDDSPLRAWDQALAFYAGSLEGISGDVESVLLFDLADRMCVQFRTCGTTATLDSGTSFVNNAVVSEFQNGQKHVLKRNCDRVRKSKDRIVKLMAIPLVQATLHMAYQQSFAPQATEERVLIDEVKGAAYAATVLPLVHDCGKKDAASIYENLKYKNGEMRDVVDFSAVKDAFERNYECMGITCEEVGGIWTKDGYSEFALPCNGASSKFYFTTLVCVLILSCFLFVRFRMQEGIDRNFERDSPNFPGIFQRNTRSFD